MIHVRSLPSSRVMDYTGVRYSRYVARVFDGEPGLGRRLDLGSSALSHLVRVQQIEVVDDRQAEVYHRCVKDQDDGRERRPLELDKAEDHSGKMPDPKQCDRWPFSGGYHARNDRGHRV